MPFVQPGTYPGIASRQAHTPPHGCSPCFFSRVRPLAPSPWSASSGCGPCFFSRLQPLLLYPCISALVSSHGCGPSLPWSASSGCGPCFFSRLRPLLLLTAAALASLPWHLCPCFFSWLRPFLLYPDLSPHGCGPCFFSRTAAGHVTCAALRPALERGPYLPSPHHPLRHPPVGSQAPRRFCQDDCATASAVPPRRTK